MIRLAVVLVLLLAGSPARAFDPFREAGIDQRPGAAIPLDLSFRDEAGRPATLRALAAGRPILLVPVLHDCPNICGVTLSGLMQAVRAQPFVPGRDFALVAFGIDPREGPAAAEASLATLRRAFPRVAPDGIHAVTGDAAAIAAVTDALGYRYGWDEAIGQYAHIAATAVITPQGRLARWLYGLAPAAQDVRLALTEAGDGQLGNWTDQILLLCYHYDPTSGRYNSLVWTALRIGGGLIVALVAGSILFAAGRERRAPKDRGS
ncbi:MAG: SCO family protein [Rhodospirillales bacterium]